MKIETTTDYSVFRTVEGNRHLNASHIRALEQSIALDSELLKCSPIIVNDKMEVIDGQHRLAAAKNLKLPISYIVFDTALGLEEIQRLNTRARMWGPLDFAKSYAELGNKHYKTYLEFKNKYNLVHHVLVAYLSGINTQTTPLMFRNGKFKVADEKQADDMCRMLLDTRKYYDRGDTRSFALGFRVVATNPKYDHARMIEQMENYPKLLVDCVTSIDYTRMLERVFNHNYAEADKVRFF